MRLRPAADLLAVALALGGALGLFAIVEARLAGAHGFPLDDSWIHLHFARNLAEGHGFSYNPDAPVAGSTAPLWTLVLGGAFALLGANPLWAKTLGVGAVFGTALLTRRLAWRWTGSRGLALVAALATALAGPLVWGALSGMEVALAALLVTGALLCHAAGRDAAAAGLLAMGVLARPEAALLVPLVWLGGPLTLRRSALLWGGVALGLAPWIAFNLATTGSPLPAPASAKIEGGLLGLLSGAREPLGTTLLGRPWQFTVEWVGWLARTSLLLPLLVPLGLAALGRARDRRTLAVGAVLILHPLGMALLAPYRGPGFQEGRYSIHLLPLAVVMAVLGLRMLGPRLRAAAAALVLASVLGALGPAAARYGWAVQNIEAMQVHLGRWAAARTPPGARLALNDVGAIAYLSRREVVDLMGLVTPGILPYRRQGEAGVLRYLERTCPDYLVIFPEWFPRLAAMTDHFVPLYRVRLDHNTVAGAAEMVVYESPWNRWRAGPRPCPPPDGR